MGSPISSLYPDMVMSDLEKRCLEMLKTTHRCTRLFFIRYIDDILLCTDSSHINTIVNIFNSYNDRLRFTYELEKDKTLNFLEITLKRSDDKLLFNWYRKSTNTTRVLNYFSNHLSQHKKAIK